MNWLEEQERCILQPMKLTLVFPAYNEAESISGVLEGFSQYCRANNIDHEIIVVNDGSHDATSTMVKHWAGSRPSVQLIEHATNQGYGAALRSGLAAARGDFVFYTDGDGQFRPEDLDQTLPLLDAKTIVLGYRLRRSEGLVRRLNAWLWGRCIGLIFGFRVRDLDCAWKLFPRAWLNSLTLVSRGAFISAELLYYARQSQLTFQELPVRHWPRRFGTSTGANIWVIVRAFRELVYFFYHHPA